MPAAVQTSLLWATLTIPPASALNSGSSGAAERQLSVAGNRAVVQLTYGEERIGGLVLNVLPAGAGSPTLLVQVLWGFALDAINDVRLVDRSLPAGSTQTHYTGSQATPDAALVAGFAAQSITYTQTLAGYAYSVLAIPTSLFGTQLAVTARLRGRRLYDPRKDSTAGGTGTHRLATPSTWEWSDNPTLAHADYLSNAVYGAGQAVDWATVGPAANANDTLVGGEKRRIIGLSFISASRVAEVSEVLRAHGGNFLRPGASGVRFLADADATAAASYAHASGDIAALQPLNLRDNAGQPTAVEVVYTDTTKVPWRDNSATASLPGAGTTRPWRLSQVRMAGVQRYSQANREAIERLNKLTLQDLSTAVEVFDIGIRHEAGDIVNITHPVGLVAKPFRVVGVDMPAVGRWALTLVEHDPACYSSVVETVPTYANTGLVISEAAGGGSGISSYMIEIYRQAATQPATPQGGQYTFAGDVFVPPASWSRSQPAGTTVPTWASRYLVQTTTPAVAIDIPSGVCELGPTWAASTVGNRNHQSIAYGNGLFVIADNAGTGQSQWSNDNGSTWNLSTNNMSVYGGSPYIAFGGGIFFAHLNAVECATSTDGNNWDTLPHTSVSSTTEPVYAFGKFFIFGDSSYYIGNSSGGIGAGTLPANTANSGGAFGGGLLVTIGQLGGSTSKAGYSTDGITFTEATTPPAFTCSRIAYGAGRCVAIRGVGSPVTNYAHTTDGITWSTGTLPASRNWVDVVFAQGAFLVICTGSGGDDIARSEDGLTWELVDASKRFTSSAGFDRIAASDTGQYVAINRSTNTAINRGGCVAAASWSVPNKHVVDGAGGSNGVVVFAYQRSSTGAPTLPSASATYTFATGVLTGLNNGWAATIPAGTDPLYVTAATARSESATDTIAAAEWSTSALLAASGLNNASVLLFRRTTTATAPALPSAAVTYTFATGVASGLTEGWEQSLPTTGGGYRWVTNATALSAGTTDTIATTEWAAAALLSQDGDITYVMTLSTNAVFMPADSNGDVLLPQAKQVAIVVRYGNTDVSPIWIAGVVAKSDTSITTSVSGQVVTITNTGVEDGWVDINASVPGPGIDALGPLRVNVTKQRQITFGPIAMPGVLPVSATATSPADAVAIVEFRANGEIWAGSGSTSLASNWFAPSTATAGNDYDVRFDLLDSQGATGGLTGASLATWLQINSTRSLTLTTSENSATTRARTFSYSIRRRSNNAQVSSGTIVLNATVS